MSERLFKLLLIDEDPLFRLGLRTWLEQWPDWQIVAEANSVAVAQQMLALSSGITQASATEESNEAGPVDRDDVGENAADASIGVNANDVDLVVLEIDLDSARRPLVGLTAGLQLCQQLKEHYPQLPIFLLTEVRDPVLLAAALQLGVKGYCVKGTPLSELVVALQVVVAGDPYWPAELMPSDTVGSTSGSPPDLTPDSEPGSTLDPTLASAIASGAEAAPASQAASSQAASNQVGDRTGAGSMSDERLDPITTPPTPVSQPAIPFSQRSTRRAGPLDRWRRNLRLSGMRQIDTALAELTGQLQLPGLSLWDREFLKGRCRELRTARWLVNRLLASSRRPAWQPEWQPGEEGVSRPVGPVQPGAVPQADVPRSNLSMTTMGPSQTSAIASQPTATSVQVTNLRAALFDATLNQIQSGLTNLSDSPLEIDILEEGKKRELLYIVLRKLEDGLDELRYSQVTEAQLSQQKTGFLRDLWQAAIADFLGKYYTLPASALAETRSTPANRSKRNRNLQVVPRLLADADLVQREILDKIPLVEDLLAHLLFQTPLKVDNDTCVAGSPPAMVRAEALLQNLLIQVANSVMQPLLNRFANVEAIKQNFYHRRLLSSREIERFRNDLSWKYRLEQYVVEPKAIFESQFRLLVLDGRGIKPLMIYAARDRELAQIEGIQRLVALALETRDAIAPRLRTAVSFVGSGLVYLLTQVIGRGIGLIGRGILQSIGHSFQEGRFGKGKSK